MYLFYRDNIGINERNREKTNKKMFSKNTKLDFSASGCFSI